MAAVATRSGLDDDFLERSIDPRRPDRHLWRVGPGWGLVGFKEMEVRGFHTIFHIATFHINCVVFISHRGFHVFFQWEDCVPRAMFAVECHVTFGV